MIEALAAVGIVVLTVLWFALPFLPAIAEWHYKRDAHPLRVVQDYEREVRHFARRFRAYVDTHLPAPDDAAPAEVWLDVDDPSAPDAPIEPSRFGGAPYVLVRDEPEPPLTDAERAAGYTARLLLAEADVTLPGRMAYLSEVYAAGNVRGEYNNIYRAILCDRDAFLGAESMVLRWLHAGGDAHIGASSVLYGRLSAEGNMVLEPGCRFARLHAPHLRFGEEPEGLWAQARNRSTFELAGATAAELAARRWLVHRSLRIPPASRFRGDLVVYGTLHIGEDCVIEGSIKTHGDLYVGRGTHIEGGLVSVHSIQLEADCSLKGPVLAETNIWIAKGCRMGTRPNPTTVSAPYITVDSGVVAYGTVWARERGELRG